MYQGTGELQKISKFKVKYTTDKSIQCSDSITNTGVMIKCQSLSIEIKFKCDDLVSQVSITISYHYQC